MSEQRVLNTHTHAYISYTFTFGVISSTFKLEVATNLVTLELDCVVNNVKLMKNKAALHGKQRCGSTLKLSLCQEGKGKKTTILTLRLQPFAHQSRLSR